MKLNQTDNTHPLNPHHSNFQFLKNVNSIDINHSKVVFLQKTKQQMQTKLSKSTFYFYLKQYLRKMKPNPKKEKLRKTNSLLNF